jgi:DNA (cytosine-5)-methyltransferase 1
MTHVDLFSGIGGFALAAEWAGFTTIAFVEIDPYCQAVLKKHWPEVPIFGDIKGFKWPMADSINEGLQGYGKSCQCSRELPVGAGCQITLLTGGFPCQPFSCAGKRRGKEDDRYLWPQMFRVISEVRPTWVLAENVAGIVKMELDNCLSDLESEDYETEAFIIPACAVNAPHRRDRVWIVAHGKDTRVIGRKWVARNDEVKNIEGGNQGKRSSGYDGGQDVADTKRILPQRHQCGRGKTEFGRSCRWSVEPDVGRVAHGVPSRVDRLKCLGNAIVPQVAFPILQAIAQIEREKK